MQLVFPYVNLLKRGIALVTIEMISTFPLKKLKTSICYDVKIEWGGGVTVAQTKLYLPVTSY